MTDIKVIAAETEKALDGYVPEINGDRLTAAMRYSLLNGGKRIRACLTVMFAELHGGDAKGAMPFACALEMIHAHSLIHDDLPCMDDDAMRRGRPSCHIAYGEATALLAGDALLARAFGVIADADELTLEQKVRGVSVLSSCTGENGMLGGQQKDKLYENLAASEDILNDIQNKKTGALIRAACELGCIAAQKYDEASAASARSYASALGRAFQITDDILDVTSSSEVLGKPAGSDESMNKSTYVSVLGLDAARAKVKELTAEAEQAVRVYGEKAYDLIKLAYQLTERKN